DVIIWRSPLERSGYDCVRFLDDVSVPLASPHFLETHPIRVPRDFVEVPLIHLSSRSAAWSQWLDKAGVAVRR
ncbi:hypothetical protein ACMWP9_36780, partial [Escherichia coli]